MKRSTLGVLFLALVSTAAYADNDKGFYAGVGVGQFNVQIENVNSGTFKSDDAVYKVFGGWRFNPYIGVELDYIDLGAPKDNVNNANVETKLNGWAPYLTGTLPLGPIELLARAGYYFYNIQIHGTTSPIDKSESDLVYGVGIGLTLFDHLHARLEYEEFDLKEAKNSNAVWLSGAWRF
jgi:OOP family OmpA-OmpF porin